eukprot:TRINITY_DN5367_c0_g1_i1.p1 TRINITY_DN5367_c0_g1~~TRINITY_DN5367_c0_g1_i1.p1  ORF type:complete len:483 (+),score=77.38 TRINITY_DN5367_c0_g1_i1:105-1553(+)
MVAFAISEVKYLLLVHLERAKQPPYCRLLQSAVMDLNSSAHHQPSVPTTTKPAMARRRSSGVYPEVLNCANMAPVDALSQQGYSIRDMLGKGSFGEVWSLTPTRAAREASSSAQADTHNMVAKMIFKTKSNSSLTTMRSRNAVLREAYVASHGHEHLISCMSLLETSTSYVLCMERADQGDLFTALQEDRFAGSNFGHLTGNIVKDIASGLRFLHERLNMMHLDVKPENVLLTSKSAKLCDFGSALPAYSHGVRLAGSAPYTSPELLAWYHQQKGSKQKLPFEVLPTYDVWGLAVLSMTVLLRGHAWCTARADDKDFQRFYTVVLQGGDLHHLPTSSQSPWCYIPVPLLQLYQKALAFNPEHRPTMEQFEGMLHRVWAPAAQCYETGLDMVVESDGSLRSVSDDSAHEQSSGSEASVCVASRTDTASDDGSEPARAEASRNGLQTQASYSGDEAACSADDCVLIPPEEASPNRASSGIVSLV